MRGDIRIPIGLMFAVLGLMLTVFGVFTNFGIIADRTIYERSLGININIWWGLILLAFGAGMYYFGRRADATIPPTDAALDGTKTEPRKSQKRRH
jgi:hypothetical protein